MNRSDSTPYYRCPHALPITRHQIMHDPEQRRRTDDPSRKCHIFHVSEPENVDCLGEAEDGRAAERSERRLRE